MEREKERTVVHSTSLTLLVNSPLSKRQERALDIIILERVHVPAPYLNRRISGGGVQGGLDELGRLCGEGVEGGDEV